MPKSKVDIFRSSKALMAMNFKRKASTLAAIFSFSVSASAAEIEVIPPDKSDDITLILISGEIKSKDDEKFGKIAVEHPDAFVILNSEGGMISPAMEIGRTIKLRGYSTAITKTGTCASACALVWLAGTKRFIFEGGAVGFHASYRDTNGQKLETSVGNALIGHYLSQLGFGQKTVTFATFAAPDKILWLNEKTENLSGIDYEIIPDADDKKSPVARVPLAPPPPITFTAPPPRTSKQKIINSETKFNNGFSEKNLRSPDEFLNELKKKGYQADISYEIDGIPMIEINVGGEDVGIAFSSCNGEGCNYIQIIDWYTDINKDEAYYLARILMPQETYGHPYWDDNRNLLALYNYMVIGSDGITVKTLIDNLNYFVRDSLRLTNLIIDRREKDN